MKPRPARQARALRYNQTRHDSRRSLWASDELENAGAKDSFEAYQKDRKRWRRIESMRARDAEKLGVNSTPTFFINGKLFRGTMTIDERDEQIEPLVKS